MREFFKGWRRKVGVVTLLIALMLMAGWVRGATICDSVAIVPITGTHAFRFESHHGRFVSSHAVSPKPETAQIIWHASYPSEGVYSDRLRWYWRFTGCGFECAYWHEDLSEGAYIIFPCWSLVIPLTLISAYLLLSKSLNSTQKKITEPILEKAV